jgi:dipeptidyl aminopeptidase/acylaminoacyl peptidase
MPCLPTFHRSALHRAGLSLLMVATAAGLLMGGEPAFAQADAAAKDAPLDKFINLDAKDTATKLEVITQTLYEHEQRMIALNFAIEYAGRVQMKFVQYPAADKSLVPGYVFRSAKPVAGKRPALVIVHGGFHERFNVEWFPMIELAVARGYVVIFPEYRGSRGYGANHYRNDYGNTDRADVLSAADYLARQPDVDAERLGIIGESRGGMVTLLAIERAPKKFKAAVDIVGLTDFVAYMGYKPEYRRQEVAKESPSFKGQLPFENLGAYMEASPINNVDAIETPLLVLATTGDKIAPLQLHTGRLLDALKARGKTFEAKIYDDAPGGHIFMHGDSPEREDATRRIFEFVGRLLKP